MKSMGAGEGEWFAVGDKEFKVMGDQIYERRPTDDIISAGIMISNADVRSPERRSFHPKPGTVYYYWCVNAASHEWELKCSVYQLSELDKKNLYMNNCFPDKETAEEFRKTFCEMIRALND